MGQKPPPGPGLVMRASDNEPVFLVSISRLAPCTFPRSLSMWNRELESCLAARPGAVFTDLKTVTRKRKQIYWE